MSTRDRYSTYTILGMVEEIEPMRYFWTQLAFGSVVNFDTDTIEFDVKLGKNGRVAPFVSPLVAGIPIAREGFQTHTMKAAYLKPKSFVAPTDALKRTAGEGQNNAQMSPAQRMDMLMAQELMIHDEMISNRIEWMASKVILEGGYTVQGEGYQAQQVDFRHPTNLKVALAGTATWDLATATPIDDIEDMAQRVRTQSKGAIADTLIMHTSAWQKFRVQASVIDRMNLEQDTSMYRSRFDLGVRVDPLGLHYVGNLDGRFEIFVYDDYLTKDDGSDYQIMPDNTVVVMSRRSIQGAQYYGAILDADAGFQPMRMYSKSRSSWDPTGEELLTQSAPLVAPGRANTWGILNVA